ncbi:hypothetical protein DFH29DRAFT_897060 [Suillus ampliporus]|nr:hypothetical protein DFH29DRAFT_897060 [Suillus ampliporus]
MRATHDFPNGHGVSHLKGPVNYFQWVVVQCLVGHPDRAAVLTNVACARLEGYFRKDLPDIDITTSLLRDVLTLRLQGHLNHPLSLFHLTEALTWRHGSQRALAYIRESAQLYSELLSLRQQGTYLRNIAVGVNGVDDVIRKCNDLPDDVSGEDIRLRRVVLEQCVLQAVRFGTVCNPWIGCH